MNHRIEIAFVHSTHLKVPCVLWQGYELQNSWNFKLCQEFFGFSCCFLRTNSPKQFSASDQHRTIGCLNSQADVPAARDRIAKQEVQTAIKHWGKISKHVSHGFHVAFVHIFNSLCLSNLCRRPSKQLLPQKRKHRCIHCGFSGRGKKQAKHSKARKTYCTCHKER